MICLICPTLLHSPPPQLPTHTHPAPSPSPDSMPHISNCHLGIQSPLNWKSTWQVKGNETRLMVGIRTARKGKNWFPNIFYRSIFSPWKALRDSVSRSRRFCVFRDGIVPGWQSRIPFPPLPMRLHFSCLSIPRPCVQCSITRHPRCPPPNIGKLSFV